MLLVPNLAPTFLRNLILGEGARFQRIGQHLSEPQRAYKSSREISIATSRVSNRFSSQPAIQFSLLSYAPLRDTFYPLSDIRYYFKTDVDIKFPVPIL